MESLSRDNFLVVGYTTQDHLLLDLDHCSEIRAKQITKMLLDEFPFLGDCLIVKSSDLHYHLIFDDFCTWERICKIIEILADVNFVQRNYQQVRTFRRDLTLRISDKKGVDRYRPPPQPICIVNVPHECNDHNGISKYLYYLRMFNSNANVEHYENWTE